MADYRLSRVSTVNGKEQRELLLSGFPNPKQLIARFKSEFEDDTEFESSYNEQTKRLTITIKGNNDLKFEVVEFKDIDLVYDLMEQEDGKNS